VFAWAKGDILVKIGLVCHWLNGLF
jgi:hypothetical protein